MSLKSKYSFGFFALIREQRVQLEGLDSIKIVCPDRSRLEITPRRSDGDIVVYGDGIEAIPVSGNRVVLKNEPFGKGFHDPQFQFLAVDGMDESPIDADAIEIVHPDGGTLSFVPDFSSGRILVSAGQCLVVSPRAGNCITLADDPDPGIRLDEALQGDQGRLQRLEVALSDMVKVARFHGWEDAVDGRRVVFQEAAKLVEDRLDVPDAVFGKVNPGIKKPFF